MPISERAAQPTVVHVILCTFFGGLSHWILCLALGTNKQDAAAFGYCILDSFQSSVEHWNSLCQIHDVDAITLPINKLTHTRVPSLCLVSKVNASFQELTHCEIYGHCHFLSGLCLGGDVEIALNRRTFEDFSLKDPNPTCEVRVL